MKLFSRYILLLAVALAITAFTDGQIRMPAEWEKQETVWLSWFGAQRRDSVSSRVIEALQPYVNVSVFLWDDSVRVPIKKIMTKYNIDTSKVKTYVDPFADFWLRDNAVFVSDGNEIKIVAFKWSEYGQHPNLVTISDTTEMNLRGQFDERLGKLLNMQTIKSEYVFEGGGIECNGNGTFMIIREMALQRNPGRTLSEIENELRRTLGAKKIIWLKEGLVEDKVYKNLGPFYKNYIGGGANMHVDELCRFVNETTVLLPYISREEKSRHYIDSANYEMLEENFRILSAATTWDGKKLKIVRVPMPEVLPLTFLQVVDSSVYPRVKINGFNIGDTIFRVPAASYCNYFISNDVILVQKYWKPGMSESQKQKDEESFRIFTELFPGRKVIPIFTHSINRGGGGIHCMTRDQPAQFLKLSN